MPTRRTFLLAAAGGTVLAAGGAAALLTPAPLPPARVFAMDGLAIRGADAVAFHAEGAAVPGDPDVAHDWAGARWTFATVENRDRFAADPMRYAPAYGGFCAWAVAEKGELFSTRPENWAVVDGRLFLNFDDRVQALWDRDRAGFIAAADRRWPGIVAAA